MPIGFTLPFSASSGSVGYFETTETKLDAVTQNMRSLLLTNWGERVNRYYFGCNFREFLFENNGSDELRSKIADRILTQVEKWMPFVNIDTLNVLVPEVDSTVPENSVKVKMIFSLNSNPDLKSRFDLLVRQ